MTIAQQIITIGAVTLGTLCTRFLPFIIFPAGKETPNYIKYLGKVLPCAVTGLLNILLQVRFGHIIPFRTARIYRRRTYGRASLPEEKYVSLHCGENHMLHAAHKICFCII